MIRKWGTFTVSVAPGSHVVRCYYPMNFVSRGGDSSVTVYVSTGEVVAVEYKAPFFGMNPGRWRITEAA